MFPGFAGTNNKVQVSTSLIELALSGMREHMTSATVQTRCAFALGAICRASAKLQRSAASPEGVATLLRALKAHPADASVQWRAAFAMVNSVSLNPPARESFGTNGVAAMMRAMRVFPDDQRLQKWCCRALYQLVRGSPDNREAAIADGGVALVLTAMKMDVENTELAAAAEQTVNVLWEF